MYTIDTIPMADYGLYISSQEGLAELTEPKEQFYTIYGKEGYQITKRKGNELDIKGFIVAHDLTDFTSKTTALYNVFKAAGLRSIELEGAAIDCLVNNGFSITGVHVFNNAAYAKFQLKAIVI